MISEALRLIRVFHDLKQQELASRLKLSNSYVSEIESGKKVPTIEVMQKYADEFDIPVSSILFFSESLQSLDKGKRRNRDARKIVSDKILKFLQFIEQKTENAS